MFTALISDIPYVAYYSVDFQRVKLHRVLSRMIQTWFTLTDVTRKANVHAKAT